MDLRAFYEEPSPPPDRESPERPGRIPGRLLFWFQAAFIGLIGACQRGLILSWIDEDAFGLVVTLSIGVFPVLTGECLIRAQPTFGTTLLVLSIQAVLSCAHFIAVLPSLQ